MIFPPIKSSIRLIKLSKILIESLPLQICISSPQIKIFSLTRAFVNQNWVINLIHFSPPTFLLDILILHHQLRQSSMLYLCITSCILILFFYFFSWFFVGQKWVITKLKLKTKILGIWEKVMLGWKKQRKSNFFGNLLFKYLCYSGLDLGLTLGLSLMGKEHEFYSSSNLKWQGISLQPMLLR